MSEYKLASAEDFRRALREFLEEEIKKHVSEGQPETLALPTKGLVVTLRHPGPLAARNYLRLHRRLYDVMMEQQAWNKTAPKSERKYDASLAYQDFLNDLLGRIFVCPVFGGAKPGEIVLDDILLSDLAYIFRWLEGEIVARPDGSVDDLKPFSGGQREPPAIGVDGAEEPVPSERASGA